MAFGKQVTSVNIAFLNNPPTSVVTSYDLKVQNMSFEAIHENPLGNPMYTKSMGGTILPYSLETRYKIRFDYDKSTEASTMRSVFNSLITYNVPTKYIYIKPNYGGSSPDTTNGIYVKLEEPMRYAIEYGNTIGKFVPRISLISTDTATSLDSNWQAPL